VAVIGLGSLGARELSYSPDLDLLFVFEAHAPDAAAFFERLCNGVAHMLGGGQNDSMYRVHAAAHSIDGFPDVPRGSGGLPERLSLMRARPVAGDPELGARFVDAVREHVLKAMPDRGAIGALARGDDGAETAGARQVERFTQLFQLLHGAKHPSLNHVGTLAALDALAAVGVVPEPAKRELSQAYVFLRTVEHRLQLVHHHHSGLGSSEDLEKQLTACRHRVAELSAALLQPFANGR